jgi:aspartate/methionine/tyrosine aminotransferase
VKVRTDIPFRDVCFLMFVMDEMANEYEQVYDDVIRMTLGKSELPVSEVILREMQDALARFEKSKLVYPAGLPQLRSKIASMYSEMYGASVSSDNVVISVGTSSIFRNLFHLLLEEGDEALLPLPYYPLYQFSAMLARAKTRYYQIDTRAMTLDVDSFRENFTDRTRLVVVNSPGNPLGNVLTKEELSAIDKIVDGRAVIISDETYGNVCFDAHFTSSMQLDNVRSTFIVTNSFSKGYRMYSRRVGYTIVPDELVTPLTVIQHHTLLTTDPVPQFGALAAIDHPEEVMHLASLYKTRRDYTVKEFEAVPNVRAIPAHGSFYLTLDCHDFIEEHGISDSLTLAQAIMKQTHVATVPGSDFGLPETLRLSYSSSRYEEGIDRLVQFFSTYERE